MIRCRWALSSDIEKEYHDLEWGVPCYDDRLLFEMLNLEGQQSGLSWKTILQKRQAYRDAFYDFDPYKIAKMGEEDILKLLDNPGIVRYRLKIESIIKNAKAYVELVKAGSFSDYLWSFVENKPINNIVEDFRDIPTQSDISLKLSIDLKKKGFSFVGPTTMYAFMQAVGMVNDHEDRCFRKEVS